MVHQCNINKNINDWWYHNGRNVRSILLYIYHLYWFLRSKFSRKIIKNPYEVVYVPVKQIQYKALKLKRTDKINELSKIAPFRKHGPGIIVNGGWDITKGKKAIDNSYVIRGFYERTMENKEWENTQYYDDFLTHIKENGHKRRCTSWEEYKVKHLERWEKIYEDIKMNGYKEQLKLKGNSIGEIRVAVSRNGEVLFVDGRHRLAMAKILELKYVPVLVNVWHKEFVDRVIDLTGNQRPTPTEAVKYIRS